MKIDPDDVQVKIKLLNSSSTLAQVTLVLFDQWEEKGWRVSKTNYENLAFHDHIWIQPPSYKSGEKWNQIVFINNMRLYQEIYQKIYDMYCREKNLAENSESSMDINPDEINIPD
ncbi:MAG: hypothetical protein Q8P53_03835 [Candidatus Shapirobacteria bacterium]|nr:hypothetical protein [Candidatus Shapirobacteria bacterium]